VWTGAVPLILYLGTGWGEWLLSCPGCFAPWETLSGCHWIGDWWDPRSGLDVLEKRQLALPGIYPDSSDVQPKC